MEEFVGERTCAGSTITSPENTQFRELTVNYKKMQKSLAWLKVIVLFHTVLLGMCICMTLTCIE